MPCHGRCSPLHSFSCIWRAKEAVDAETEELGDGHPGHGAAGSALCDPVVDGKRLQHQAEDEERSAPWSQGAREMASWWSWSPAEGRCPSSATRLMRSSSVRRPVRPWGSMTSRSRSSPSGPPGTLYRTRIVTLV